MIRTAQDRGRLATLSILIVAAVLALGGVLWWFVYLAIRVSWAYIAPWL